MTIIIAHDEISSSVVGEEEFIIKDRKRSIAVVERKIAMINDIGFKESNIEKISEMQRDHEIRLSCRITFNDIQVFTSILA